MAKAKNVYKEDSIMIALLEKKGVDIKEFTQGELVEGTVVSVSSKQILVDVGAKSEGIITSDEFPQYDETYKNLKPGDTLLSSVVQPENEHGYLVLSLRRAEKDSKWRDMEDTLTSGAVLEVTVIEYNKGGLLVECFGLRGFVPLSHLDRVHFQNDIAKFSAGSEAELKSSLKVLSGKKLKVKIIELDKEKNRLVMSEKDALPTYSDTARQERLENVTEGDVLDGIVTGLMPFG
ncbi:MAG: S1 RNA-binding domain-containing protein, partial [Patescibacteria group bacterium]